MTPERPRPGGPAAATSSLQPGLGTEGRTISPAARRRCHCPHPSPGTEGRTIATRVRHRWDVTPREAIRIQQRIAPKVCLHDDFAAIHCVAGADIALDPKTNRGFAVVARFSFPEMRQLEVVHAAGELRMPYVPGLLSFREAPLLIEAFRKLREKPDILMCDGQGYAHPRRLGIACHLGLLLDIPTIGCAKSRLVGEYVEPGKRRGSTSPLFHLGEIIGMVLRTRDRVRPIFVSTGHRVGLRTAVEIEIACSPRYRVPEPTRRADALAGEFKRSMTEARKATALRREGP